MYRIYCGRNIGSRLGVTESQFETWLSQSVTPVFPGFSIQEIVGYWNGQREKSYVLEISTDNRAGVDEVANSYLETFSQDSVMVADVTEKTEFLVREQVFS